MTHQELVHEEKVNGIDIKLYTLEEYITPDWCETEEEKKELFRKIENGTLLFFCAKVTASIKGYELGEDYLGGCCYKSVDEFINDNYYKDMKNTAIEELKENLKKLQSIKLD